MREQDKMTMEQAEAKMSCLREVFPFVRLVKGSVLKDREREPAEGLPRACQCYEFWKKDKPCENCISRDVLDSYKMSRPNVQKILYKNVQLVCLS